MVVEAVATVGLHLIFQPIVMFRTTKSLVRADFGEARPPTNPAAHTSPTSSTSAFQERNKHDDKIMECVLAGDAVKLRPLVEKKKYSSLLSADSRNRVPYVQRRRRRKGGGPLMQSKDPRCIGSDRNGSAPMNANGLN